MTCDCKEHQEHIEQLRCAVKIAEYSKSMRREVWLKLQAVTNEARASYCEAHDLWKTAERELEEAEKANGN
jgi:hypothetical protein